MASASKQGRAPPTIIHSCRNSCLGDIIFAVCCLLSCALSRLTAGSCFSLLGACVWVHAYTVRPVSMLLALVDKLMMSKHAICIHRVPHLSNSSRSRSRSRSSGSLLLSLCPPPLLLLLLPLVSCVCMQTVEGGTREHSRFCTGLLSTTGWHRGMLSATGDAGASALWRHSEDAYML